jgi:hypothetical protein
VAHVCASDDGPAGDHPSIRDRPLNRRATITFFTLHWAQGALGTDDALSLKDQTCRHQTWAHGDHGFKSIAGRFGVKLGSTDGTLAYLWRAAIFMATRPTSSASATVANVSNDGPPILPNRVEWRRAISFVSKKMSKRFIP